ncbi:MAG: hypothetical protein ACP5QA_10475 [Phycisphaerae bacterium]
MSAPKKNAANPLTTWLEAPFKAWIASFDKSIANYALIGVGIVLGIGALLISQKETVIKIADTAAKGAALVG